MGRASIEKMFKSRPQHCFSEGNQEVSCGETPSGRYWLIAVADKCDCSLYQEGLRECSGSKEESGDCRDEKLPLQYTKGDPYEAKSAMLFDSCPCCVKALMDVDGSECWVKGEEVVDFESLVEAQEEE